MQPEPRCTAHARSGEQCKNRPIRGATVCRMHGGSAPAVRAKAKIRAAEMEAHAEAERMVARAGTNADPIEHLLESLHLAAGLVYVYGAMVADLDDAAARENQEEVRGGLGYTEDTNQRSPYELNVVSRDRLLALNRHGEAQLHPYVVEYQQALERRAKFAKLCIDAGVAVRQVQLVEAQVEMAQQALEAVLNALGLEPDKRQEARREYARHLRAGS